MKIITTHAHTTLLVLEINTHDMENSHCNYPEADPKYFQNLYQVFQRKPPLPIPVPATGFKGLYTYRI